MPRNRVHINNAERQRAYRQRVKDSRHVAPPAVVQRQQRAPSRPARLAHLLKELDTLTTEYEDWLSSLPEQLQETATAEKLTETTDSLNAAADLVRDIDPPRGFGRD